MCLLLTAVSIGTTVLRGGNDRVVNSTRNEVDTLCTLVDAGLQLVHN